MWRLCDCATALTLTVYFTLHGWGWTTLHASSSSLRHILKKKKTYNPSLAATPSSTPAAHSCSVLLFLCLLCLFNPFFYGAEACLMQPEFQVLSLKRFFYKVLKDFKSYLCSLFIFEVRYQLISFGPTEFWFLYSSNRKARLLVHLLTLTRFLFFPFYVLLLVTPIGEFSGVYLSMHCFFSFTLSTPLYSPKLHS